MSEELIATDPHIHAPSVIDWLRLAAALAITVFGLSYGWGRVVISTMMDWPEPGVRVAVLMGFCVVAALTWNLGARFRSVRAGWLRWLDPLMLLIWLVESAILVSLFVGPGLPHWVVIPLFAPSMLWVPWLTWWPFRFGWDRLPVLIIFLLLGTLFPALVVIKGVTGNIQMEFAWRRPAVVPSTNQAVAGSPAAAVVVPTIDPQDFPQFLGPQRNGVANANSLSRDWKAHVPQQVWRQPVGQGWSSFAIAGKYCFTQEQDVEQECVVCRRMSDGSEVWRHADKASFKSVMGGDGPRATPTVADGFVYTVGATGRLNCLNGSDGSVVWSADIVKENNGGKNIHGVCASPLVYEELVIVAPTGTSSAVLAAYDRKSGRPAWQAAGAGEASYSSPTVVRLADQEVLLLHNTVALAAYDPQSGEELWQFPWSNDVRVNASQCIVIPGDPDRIVVTTGYSVGAALLEVSCAKNGNWTVDEKWKSRGMKTKFTTAVLHGSAIYGIDDGILAAIDLETGKQLWKGGRYGHGQVLLAGDLLLVQSETGEVILIDPQPARLVELGRIPALTGKTWNNPALSRNLLLVRNDHEAACYRLPTQIDSTPSGKD